MPLEEKLALSESTLAALRRDHRLSDPVYITRPLLPRLEDYTRSLERIWDSHQLANDGPFHIEFEKRLGEYLGVEHLTLFCNGTIALMVALHALRLNGGEVITTPFTFPATTHVLYWNGIRPVFCDIDPTTFNLDPNRLEELISAETRAILPVHVYGTPCDVGAIRKIADRHGLNVIYDAAHGFGVKLNGRSVLEHGDMSVLSFHATKLFTTIEGGALICRSATQKRRVDFLRNFGIADEETVIGPGINGKLNEFQAAFGLLGLKQVDEEIERRGSLANAYRDGLGGLPGISLMPEQEGVQRNNCYFPILIDAEAFGLSRDEVYALLREFNVYARKYFHPITSRYSCYSSRPSAAPSRLPVAERVSDEVLCLPLYGRLPLETVETICTLFLEFHRHAR